MHLYIACYVSLENAYQYRNHFEVCQSILFFLTSSFFCCQSEESKLVVFCQSLTYLGEAKYPALALSRHNVHLSWGKGEVENWDTLVKFTVQGMAHQDWNLIMRLCKASPQPYLTATLLKTYLPQFLLPICHVHFSTKNYKAYKQAKNSLKRLSKHQN